MLLSPPFITNAFPANETEDQFIDRLMASGNAGDGGFPVSFEMNWHGGIHLSAPLGNAIDASVRAIADGTVVFLRQSTPRSSNPNHPLNYRGHTDNGCLVIRHDTDIGFDTARQQITSVTFCSIYMHLSAIPNSVRPGQRVFRKDVVGTPGSIYGVAGKVHLEIVCDDNNINMLVGRTNEFLSIQQDGRTDVVFGAMWFLLLVGTPFHTSQPQPGKPLPPAVTQDEAFLVSMTFAGPDAIFRTHHIDGQPVGADIIVPGFAFALRANANRLFPASPSAGFELLRFGRVLGPDPLNPPNAPFWCEVRLPNGKGWVDLNDLRVKKFSDADFPHWDGGWVLVDGSASPDSRVRELRIMDLLDVDKDLSVDPEEAQQKLNDPTVQRELSHKIVKFPTEWDGATIDQRFGWLKTDSRTQMTAADFARFKAHAQALCFWQVNQIGIDGNHWHFHPTEFIRRFRKCLWLSPAEVAQSVPQRDLTLSGTRFVNQPIADWATAFARGGAWASHLNTVTRKYLIAGTPQRLAHFFAQLFAESAFLRLVVETGGARASYAPYFGRGLIQLTHQRNYNTYGTYRRFTSTHPNPAPPFQAIGWNPNTLIAASNTQFDAANCADTAGFYWNGSNAGGLSTSDGGTSTADIIAVSRFVNGNVSIQNLNGLDIRIENFIYMKYVLMDLLRPVVNTEQVSFNWRRNSNPEPLLNPDGTPMRDNQGNPRQGFIVTTNPWVLAVPLDPQRP